MVTPLPPGRCTPTSRSSLPPPTSWSFASESPSLSHPAVPQGVAMLSQVVQTRSTKPAAAEPGMVIEHREALIYMICEAAELEHGLMCEYLFAAFSLKDRVDEGVSEDQLAAIQRWRSTVLGVAAQEMLHLALTANM